MKKNILTALIVIAIFSLLLVQKKGAASESSSQEEVFYQIEDLYPDFVVGMSPDILDIVGEVQTYTQVTDMIDMAADSLLHLAPENTQLWLRDLYYHQDLSQYMGLEVGPEFSGDLSIGQIQWLGKKKINLSWDPRLKTAPTLSRIIKLKMLLLDLPLIIRAQKLDTQGGKTIERDKAFEVIKFVNSHLVISSLIDQIPESLLVAEISELGSVIGVDAAKSLIQWQNSYREDSSSKYIEGILSILPNLNSADQEELGEITEDILEQFNHLGSELKYSHIVEDSAAKIERFLRLLIANKSDNQKLQILFEKQHLGKIHGDLTLESETASMIKNIKQSKGCFLSLVK